MSSGRHRPVAAPLPHRFRLAISVESRPDARRRTPAALGKSIVEPEEHPADRFPEVEIDVAARIIKANMMTGRDTTLLYLLQVKFRKRRSASVLAVS